MLPKYSKNVPDNFMKKWLGRKTDKCATKNYCFILTTQFDSRERCTLVQVCWQCAYMCKCIWDYRSRIDVTTLHYIKRCKPFKTHFTALLLKTCAVLYQSNPFRVLNGTIVTWSTRNKERSRQSYLNSVSCGIMRHIINYVTILC